VCSSDLTARGPLSWKLFAKHRPAALRLCVGRFVLQHVPMLRKQTISDAYDVGCDPAAGSSMTREPSVDDHDLLFGDDCTVFVSQRRRYALDQIEEGAAPRRDMRAVLDVFRRPVPLGGLVISLVEERIECIKYQRFVVSSTVFDIFVLPLRVNRLAVQGQ
jgi:hypothetical protein